MSTIDRTELVAHREIVARNCPDEPILVDAEDFVWLSTMHWCVADVGAGKRYATCREKIGPNRYRHLYMHRMLLAVGPGHEVDHANGNGLDNRTANLRAATRSQNNGNQRKRAGTTSRFKGVSWVKDRNEWQAGIGCGGGKRRALGRFLVEEDAARAYDAAALARWGAFARLNFPVVV